MENIPGGLKELRRFVVLAIWGHRHRQAAPKFQKVGFKTRRQRRVRLRAALRNEAFVRVARHVARLPDRDAVLFGLWMILEEMHLRVDGTTPREIRKVIKEQAAQRQEIAETLNTPAPQLVDPFRGTLKQTAEHVAKSPFALHGAEIGGVGFDDFAAAGKRGGGSVRGQWDAFFIKRFNDCLPDEIKNKYELISALMRLGGADTSRQLVRSVLLRGHT